MSTARSFDFHVDRVLGRETESRVLRFPTRPELGPVKTISNDTVDGGVLINVAGVVELARTGGTPQAKAIYREFCTAWDVIKDEPGSEGSRQIRALQIALKVIGLNIST